MYISKFQVEGFRGFKDALTLELDPKVNVLVGVNGAGKSSLLEAINIALYWFKSQFNSAKDRSILENDDLINNFSKKFQISIELKNFEDFLKWTAYKERKQEVLFGSKGEKSEMIFELYKKRNEVPLPILQYYNSSRIIRSSDSKIPAVYAPYDDIAENQSMFYADFKSWFINAKNKENHIIRLNENKEFKYSYLAALEDAFISFFNCINGADVSFSNLDIFYPEDQELNLNISPELKIDKNGMPIQLGKLSDGEKLLLVLVGIIVKDLCNMCTITFGMANTSEMKPKQILGLSGIVLIDEIELHLHPAWQRNIIPALTTTFPNIQFIVTTHSPQVLSNVESKSVFILEDFKLVEKTPATKGKDSNSILWEIFGVEERPEEIKNLLKQFYNALEDDTEKAESLLNVLVSMLGKDDKEVQRAKYHLDIEVRLSKETD